jgi:hypothetical protein
MDEAKVLLRAYFEALYERLEDGREDFVAEIESVLNDVIKDLVGDSLTPDKYDAYRHTCLAFLEERIDMYNPVGTAFLFDRPRSKRAFELELQLNWYDSTAEFEVLSQAVIAMAVGRLSDEELADGAAALIEQCGAFPDRSIIAGYESSPELRKLPDYVVARAIEQGLRS